MQRGMGILAIFAVLVAGARFTAGPSLQRTSEGPTSAAAQHVPASTPPPETGCSEFAGRGEQGHSAPGEIAALIDRYLDLVPGQAPAHWKLPEETRIILATVPDPLHTHLNLQFDRTMEALQQAAQDEYFTYDSSWLPWKSQITEFSSRGDQDKEEEATPTRTLPWSDSLPP
jgi:hypothetical protein